MLQKFYGLSNEFRDLLYIREVSSSKPKVLLVTEGLNNFLKADVEKKIKLVNMGCKVF